MYVYIYNVLYLIIFVFREYLNTKNTSLKNNKIRQLMWKIKKNLISGSDMFTKTKKCLNIFFTTRNTTFFRTQMEKNSRNSFASAVPEGWCVNSLSYCGRWEDMGRWEGSRGGDRGQQLRERSCSSLNLCTFSLRSARVMVAVGTECEIIVAFFFFFFAHVRNGSSPSLQCAEQYFPHSAGSFVQQLCISIPNRYSVCVWTL